MKKPSSLKTTIAVIAVIILAAAAYFYYQGSSAPVLGLQAESAGLDVGLSVVNVLNQIQTIRMDTSLFSEPIYLGLQDFSVAIPAQSVGRPNPFDPIPGFNPASAAGTVR